MGFSERSFFHKARCTWSRCLCWFCLVSCQPLQRNQMLDQSLQLVTSSRLALVHRVLDSLFIYEEKTLHKEEAFCRRESQGVKYPPSYAQLPSLRKGPSGKLAVGSVQAGRRVRNPQQWPYPIPQARAQLNSGLLFCILPGSADPQPTCSWRLVSSRAPAVLTCQRQLWKDPDWEPGLTLPLTNRMTSYKSLSLPSLCFLIHEITLPILPRCQRSEWDGHLPHSGPLTTSLSTASQSPWPAPPQPVPHIYQSSSLLSPWAPRSKLLLTTPMLQIHTPSYLLGLSICISHKCLKLDLSKTEHIIFLSKLGLHPVFFIPAIPLASTQLLKPETWGLSLTRLQHPRTTAAAATFHHVAWETEKAGLKQDRMKQIHQEAWQRVGEKRLCEFLKGYMLWFCSWAQLQPTSWMLRELQDLFQ